MSIDYVLPKLPVTLPTESIPKVQDVASLRSELESLLLNLPEESLAQDAVWRDHFALTGTIRTFYGACSIHTGWQETSQNLQCHSFAVSDKFNPGGPGGNSWLDVSFTFRTRGPPALTASGNLSLVPGERGSWKIWGIRTMMDQLCGQPDVDHFPETSTGTDIPSLPDQSEPGHFDCVILGGGQAGLAIGGRLQALGVSYVILEKHAKVGDNWSSRYDSAKLHTIREYAHLPFERTFDESYPEWLTKDDLARGYNHWASKYNIKVWLSTTMLSGSWDEPQQKWTIEISKDGVRKTLESSFFVFAAGIACEIPLMPEYEQRDVYKGVVLHSAHYKNSKAWKGLDGVVVGSANTAHDIAEDMLEAGLASITMIQRSPTYVVPQDHYTALHRRLYNRDLPTELADRITYMAPAAVGRLMLNSALESMASKEPDRYDSLEMAGFRIDKASDLPRALLVRPGGHYMDIGACQKIARGQIKVKSDSLPVSYSENGLVFENGDQIQADVIVFATGFSGDMRSYCRQLFGSSTTERIGDLWGLDREGELKGAFKFCDHPGFLFAGGAIGQTRFYSRFVALQIKAKLLGTPLQKYTRGFEIDYR